MIRVLLVEDDELFRFGLGVALKQAEHLDLVDVCTDGRTVLAKVETHQPDLILMDLVLPGLSGVEATRQIKLKYPDIKVLVLTSHSDSRLVDQAIQAGADGFCLKGLSSERLLAVINEVAQGAFWLDANVANYIKTRLSDSWVDSHHLPVDERNLDSLTERERTILSMLAEGRKNQEIADDLGISIATVRVHIHSIFKKLDFRDRTMAALFMQQISRKKTDSRPR